MNQSLIQQITDTYPTPVYVFDMSVLRQRMTFLREKLGANISLCYAVMANTFILKQLEPFADRFEVCSPGELHICRRQKLSKEKLVISGVYKSPELMEMLIRERWPVCAYTVESVQQFELLKTLAARYDVRIPLLFRLTGNNQFGTDGSEILKMICESAGNHHIDMRGIQYFSGTQKRSLRRLEKELEQTMDFIQTVKAQCGIDLPELEFGPGLPVAYFNGDDLDEDAFLRDFSRLLERIAGRVKLTLELGRSIAAACGSYLTRVVDTKTNGGQNYAIVDGGIHQLVYYGQSMAMKQPLIECFPKREKGTKEHWNLCGSLCTINDLLVKQLPVMGLQKGDVILFKNTGAYAMTEGIALFLSRDLPAILLYQEDGTLTCVREALGTYPLNTPCL